ncbi:SCN5A, partial [Symbiodinium necroappetens]
YEVTFAGNWTTRTRRPVLEDVDHSYAVFFVIYVTLIVFAVLRVITAVFLRETLEAANNDAELMVMERLRQKGKYIKRLEGIFRAMDESGDGVLSEAEMSVVLADAKVQAYLASLDLDLNEGQALYRLLQNGEGQVTYEDFIDGILRCKGPARAIDQICLQCDVKLLSDAVMHLTKALEDSKVIKKQRNHGKHRRSKHRVEDEVVLLRAATRVM